MIKLISFIYLDEQVASKTELYQEPEHHASKYHLDDTPNSSYSSIGSILHLGFKGDAKSSIHSINPIF